MDQIGQDGASTGNPPPLRLEITVWLQNSPQHVDRQQPPEVISKDVPRMLHNRIMASMVAD
jgi:hypothetical protein